MKVKLITPGNPCVFPLIVSLPPSHGFGTNERGNGQNFYERQQNVIESKWNFGEMRTFKSCYPQQTTINNRKLYKKKTT